VDARFHGSPAFTAVQAWAAGALIQAGLPRGPARGAAHVGTELFLDGALAGDARARRAYARCLADADTTGTPFFWRDEQSSERWRRMVQRLRGAEIPDRYRDPDFVADRLIGALGRRPRLALTGDDAAILRRFLPAFAAHVQAAAPALASGILIA
jgi:hypothetical protein